METDATTIRRMAKRPFFYHLGDVVYYNGETSEYFPQFLFALRILPPADRGIPGNHDGGSPDDPPTTPQPFEPSLSAWKRNFCSDAGGITNEAGEHPRHAMKQPNPFWTLRPEATHRTLRQCAEGGAVKDDQKRGLVTN